MPPPIFFSKTAPVSCSIIIVVLLLESSMVAGLQEHRWSRYTSYSRTTWLTRVCQFAGKHISPRLITRCAYAQGRVKRLSPSIYIFVCICVCVSSKNTAVCCLTARKSPRNSSLPLGLAIYILRKMPRKPDESSVECYGHGFLIAARPRGV